MPEKTRVVVIGGGVAGYTAALRAAGLGGDVTLVERSAIGGTCLNRGCIPTKALLHSAGVIATLRSSETFGVRCRGFDIDFDAVMARKRLVVERLGKGVKNLLAAGKVRVVSGTAEFVDAGTVQVIETGERISAGRFLVATGSKPAIPPIEGLDRERFWDSDDVLDMEALPKSAVIIGGGFVGVEFAQILKSLGTDVTVLEAMPGLTPGLDGEIASTLEKLLSRQGIRFVTTACVTGVVFDGESCQVTFNRQDRTENLSAQRLIVTTGRKPDVSLLAAERAGIAVEKGKILVDDRMETSVPGIYAAGDATGGILLAHAAAAEGLCAAENMMGADRRMGDGAVPCCIYTRPEVASAGLTEAKAAETFDTVVGRSHFRGNGKASVLNEFDGMVKIVAERRSGRVLGVHIIGPHATDMIAEAVLGMNLGATVKDLSRAIHPHPTLSETVMEAAQATGLRDE